MEELKKLLLEKAEVEKISKIVDELNIILISHIENPKDMRNCLAELLSQIPFFLAVLNAPGRREVYDALEKRVLHLEEKIKNEQPSK